MIDDENLQQWREALAEDPAGGGVGGVDLAGYRAPDTQWDYETAARNLVLTADRVLDLGTGGGEFLSQLADVLPEGTVATVGRAPHLAAARQRLEPLGIEVLEHDADHPGARLPVEASSFDLVLCRHEPYDSADIARVLTPGGAFLTQQVGGHDLEEIRSVFGLEAPREEVSLSAAERGLVQAGLTVERSDVFHGTYEFDDLPTLLRYLRAVPGRAPSDLDVDRHRGALEELFARSQNGPLQATASRFIVLAHSPSAVDAGRVDFSELPTDDLDVPRA